MSFTSTPQPEKHHDKCGGFSEWPPSTEAGPGPHLPQILVHHAERLTPEVRLPHLTQVHHWKLVDDLESLEFLHFDAGSGSERSRPAANRPPAWLDQLQQQIRVHPPSGTTADPPPQQTHPCVPLCRHHVDGSWGTEIRDEVRGQGSGLNLNYRLKACKGDQKCVCQHP